MFENVDMGVVAAGIGTLFIVLAVAVICYFVDRKLKKYIGDKQNETNSDSGVFSALVLTNNAINAFEKTLKETFNEAIDDGVITKEVAVTALDLMEVDRLGLDHIDRNMLYAIIEKFGGGPVGLDTLAASIGEDAGTIEDVYEPYLLKNGFINRTPRGRVVTELAYRHLGLENPK